MSLIYSTKANGNLKIFDVRAHVNLQHVVPAFQRLKVDPYIPEGYRRKHIAWFKGGKGTHLERLDRSTLFQSSTINSVHGGLVRDYPQIVCNDQVMYRILDLFLSLTSTPNATEFEVLVQFQRITAWPDKQGKPSVEGWHKDGVDQIGIICVGRENVVGGINQFRNSKDENGEILTKELSPGYMVIFDDDLVYHRVTELECADARYYEGHRDVILLGLTQSAQKRHTQTI